MEDKGEKRARRGGKHNLNSEDHVVFFFLLKYIVAQSWYKC